MGKAMLYGLGLAVAVLASASADETHDRRVAAFVGGLVADAAAGGLFWIYDVNQISQILQAAVSALSRRFSPPGSAFPAPSLPSRHCLGASPCDNANRPCTVVFGVERS